MPSQSLASILSLAVPASAVVIKVAEPVSNVAAIHVVVGILVGAVIWAIFQYVMSKKRGEGYKASGSSPNINSSETDSRDPELEPCNERFEKCLKELKNMLDVTHFDKECIKTRMEILEKCYEEHKKMLTMVETASETTEGDSRCASMEYGEIHHGDDSSSIPDSDSKVNVKLKIVTRAFASHNSAGTLSESESESASNNNESEVSKSAGAVLP